VQLHAGSDVAAVEPDSRQHRPSSKWAFDAEVTQCFEDMLRRSIPEHYAMRCAVIDIARHYIRPGGCVVDLGCSTGGAVYSLLSEYGKENRLVAVDSSKPMVEAARRRFARDIAAGRISVERMDLRNSYPEVQACVTLCVLTLQFIPMEHRQVVVREAFRHTVPGGAFILVEKVLGKSAGLDSAMVSNYLRLKRANGYAQNEIVLKRRSLEGVLVPLTAAWNESLLTVAGFSEVDGFWRWMNFAGWVGVRPGA